MKTTTIQPKMTTYNEIKIGRITYRLTSKFEGNKNLNDTIRRLAIKKATRNNT